jgi:HSP20 family molecular chaperone IbpA
MFTNTELTRIEPRAFMRRVFRDFDRFFETGDWPVARLGKPFADIAWMPPVEVFERDHRLTVRVELPGIKKGIRIGSARDGSVRAFIEDSESTVADHSGAEGVGVDAQGNVYGAVVRRQMLERHVLKK